MPVKLLPHLRLLNPPFTSIRFTAMKPIPSFKSSRSVHTSALSRVFPHKLKYQPVSKRVGFPNLAGLPQLELNSRGFSAKSGSAVRASKSLIEDEAELSDWVSELRSDSFHKTKLYSDSDGDDSRKGGMKRQKRDNGDFDDRGGSFRGRGSGNFRGRGDSSRGGRGNRDSFDSYSNSRDSFGSSSRGGRDSFGSSSRGGRGGRDSFDSYGDSSSRGGRGGRESFGNSSRGGRGGRDSFGSSRGGGRGGRDSFSSSREGGRGGRDSFSSSREGGRGGRDSFSSSRGGGRGGRDSFDSFDSFRGSGEGSMTQRRGGNSSRGGRREFGSDDDGGSDRGMRGSFSQRGRGRFEGKDDGFVSRRRDDDSGGFRGGRGEVRGGRGGRDGGVRNTGRSFDRGGLAVSDSEDSDEDEDEDEDEDDEKIGRRSNLRDSLKDLISESESDDDDDDDDDVDEDEDDDDDVDDLVKKGSGLADLSIKDRKPVQPKSSSGGSESYLSESRFDQCSVSPLSLKAIKDAGYEKMTVVQEATLPIILKGKDVLAKARTGTGKTVAFLLPSIEVVVNSPSGGRDQKRPPIYVLVICPTRELASQASAEANKLLKYHPSIGVQVVIGGTRLALEQKRIQANPCQILVATPGRLKDHIENTAGFATRLMGVKVLVLDEADHLLDMGFRKDIERIIAAVPKQRQTLLFSATVPEEVRQICHIALKRDHEFVNTVEEGSEETHAQVKQSHLIAPLNNHFSLLYAMLKDHIADDVDYKVLVFCTTAMVTRLVANLLGELNMNVREIHSRKPQSYRTRVSDEFRKSKGLILVTSDVSARGVDYPDVTLVIQVGLPSDKEQYIHRLGRTGRKGREGQGILMLAPWEEFFLNSLRDLPLTKASPPLVDPDTKKKVEKALSQVEMKNKEAAYQAWLGYYNSNKTVARDKTKLVELANDFSRSMGLDNPPAIPRLVLGKMGLKNVPGLRSK